MEALTSSRMLKILDEAASVFDWIIIDTPPVMAVTDAALVANRASGVIFVVGAEMTSRHAALRAVQQLQQVNSRIMGAVLNRVDLERNAYYYSQYYRRAYTTYYERA